MCVWICLSLSSQSCSNQAFLLCGFSVEYDVVGGLRAHQLDLRDLQLSSNWKEAQYSRNQGLRQAALFFHLLMLAIFK